MRAAHWLVVIIALSELAAAEIFGTDFPKLPSA
jgi:hypothetical protein